MTDTGLITLEILKEDARRNGVLTMLADAAVATQNGVRFTAEAQAYVDSGGEVA